MSPDNNSQVTASDPWAEVNSRISRLQSELSTLSTRVRFDEVDRSVTELDMIVSGLPARVSALRARGYVYTRTLESEIDRLKDNWACGYRDLRSTIGNGRIELQYPYNQLEKRVRELTFERDLGTVQARLSSAESELQHLLSQADQVEGGVRRACDSQHHYVDVYVQGIERVEWALDQIGEACFQMQAGEGIIAAVKAQWDREGQDDPKGVLYLTDARLVFEQKQEVATRKFLFVTTEKQKVQRVVLEAAVSAVQGAVPSKRGLLKNEDHLDLSFGAGAPVPAAHFHLDGQACTEWEALVRGASRGTIVSDRIDQATTAAAPAS